MSLSGDLGHFPIIDVIQLLHGSRKSGTLRLSGKKGESHLVFHDGDLVSANFLNNRVRIGQVLVSAGAITEEQLALALDIQKNAGDNCKPLVITLLENSMVEETAAYNCLESLIEMTIVDVLTWKDGHFSLNISKNEDAGGDHLPVTNFPQMILLNSQGILMDSLRIFDEKLRDGTMDEILSIAGISNLDLGAEQPGSGASVITSDGSDQYASPPVLQQLLEEQRNMVHRSRDKSFREVDAVKKLIIEEFSYATNAQKRQLLLLLAGPAPKDNAATPPPKIAAIVLTQSPLLSAIFRSICYQEGVYAVSSDTIASLDINVRLLLCQALRLVIFLDVPHDVTAQNTIQICKDLQKYPQASVVLVACSRFWDTLGLQALSSGIRSIIPRPCRECTEGSAAQQTLTFCSNLGAFLRTLSSECGSSDNQRFFTCISQLRRCRTLTEITAALLAYLTKPFERAIVFSVTKSELVAEQSFGVKGDKSEGLAPISNLHIPLDDQPVFEDVIKTGQMYYGFHIDSTCPHHLYRAVGRPDNPEVLVFPLVRANTVVALIYADFALKPVSSPSIHHLEALLQYTTVQINVSTYRQKLKSMLDRQKMQDLDRSQGLQAEMPTEATPGG